MRFLLLLLAFVVFSFGDAGSPYEDAANKAYGGIGIRDTTGNWLAVESNGGMAVNIQDQHTEIVDYRLHRNIDTTSLTVASTIDSSFIVVNDVSGADAGHYIHLISNTRYYEGEIVSISNDTLYMDNPMDTVFAVDQVAQIFSDSLNIDASGGRVIAEIEPPPSLQWDITRMIIYIQGAGAMDDSKFGDQAALTNGVVFRVKNGQQWNVFNAKTNGDFSLHTFDATYTDKAGGGSNAIRIRRSFAGQAKNGVTIRLDGATMDQLQVILQDDLDGLEKFIVVIQGHVVTD